VKGLDRKHRGQLRGGHVGKDGKCRNSEGLVMSRVEAREPRNGEDQRQKRLRGGCRSG
jgi:hypothetical protein